MYGYVCSGTLIFRHRKEKTLLEEKHRRQIEEYIAEKRAARQKSCAKCNPSSGCLSNGCGSVASDNSRPQTPAEADCTRQLRSIVGELLKISKDPPLQHQEQLASLDKELQYVQNYLASGRPYPRGELPSPMTKHNFHFAQQPNSDVVQSIVKRVLHAGYERENSIKQQNYVDVPLSVFEPQDKQASDNLHQVLSSVRQMLQHPEEKPTKATVCPTDTERVKKIKDQVDSSHKSVLQGLQRSQVSKLNQGSGQSLMEAEKNGGPQQSIIDGKPMSHRQITIQNEMTASKQLIEQILRTNRATKDTTTPS